jgi:hypothetical protein
LATILNGPLVSKASTAYGALDLAGILKQDVRPMNQMHRRAEI